MVARVCCKDSRNATKQNRGRFIVLFVIRNSRDKSTSPLFASRLRSCSMWQRKSLLRAPTPGCRRMRTRSSLVVVVAVASSREDEGDKKDDGGDGGRRRMRICLRTAVRTLVASTTPTRPGSCNNNHHRRCSLLKTVCIAEEDRRLPLQRATNKICERSARTPATTVTGWWLQ